MSSHVAKVIRNGKLDIVHSAELVPGDVVVLDTGDFIPADTIVQKSLAFDEYNNRTDGANFNVAYLALDDNMEDSIIFSDVAAGRLSSPLVKH